MIRQLKHEVSGEAIGVAPNLLVQAFGGYTVEQSKVRVEEEFLSSQNNDRPCNACRVRQCGRFRHVIERDRQLRFPE